MPRLTTQDTCAAYLKYLHEIWIPEHGSKNIPPYLRAKIAEENTNKKYYQMSTDESLKNVPKKVTVLIEAGPLKFLEVNGLLGGFFYTGPYTEHLLIDESKPHPVRALYKVVPVKFMRTYDSLRDMDVWVHPDHRDEHPTGAVLPKELAEIVGVSEETPCSDYAQDINIKRFGSLSFRQAIHENYFKVAYPTHVKTAFDRGYHVYFTNFNDTRKLMSFDEVIPSEIWGYENMYANRFLTFAYQDYPVIA